MDEITINGVEYVKKKGVKRTLEIKEERQELPFKNGEKIFFRTVTFHLLGRVTEITGKFLRMEDASWIADSGRFMQFIKGGKADEVEPVGTVTINTDSIIDAFPWKHELPKEQK